MNFFTKFFRKNKVVTNLAESLGFPHCYIHPYAEISGRDNLIIGHDCWFGKGLISAGEAKVVIGHNVIIASEYIIMTNSHNYRSTEYLPFDRKYTTRPIRIGDNVWIGMRCIILGGVNIEEGAVVGAGSVVTKSVPKCAIVAGNPAKIVGYRDKNLYEKLKKDGKFEDMDLLLETGFPSYSILEDSFKPFL